MSSWDEVRTAIPTLAAEVEARFRGHKHHTMATVRPDGGPRISGTEVEFADGQLRLGMMTGTLRAADLHRDPRIALHSHCVDPPADDHTAWVGEAKIAGRVIWLEGGEDHDAVAIDVEHIVLTAVGDPPDHLLIESWTPSGGAKRIQRY